LGLASSPVGVTFLRTKADVDTYAQTHTLLTGHRYCQALMRARRGQRVLVTGEGLTCPAAAAAFGFRPLPEKLATGEGLVGFGIVRTPEQGRAMFESMMRFAPGSVAGIALAPLALVEAPPDVVVVEGEVEQLMWLLLANFHVTGRRLTASTAVLQATCVDSTVLPFQQGELNFSFGCYGCREATDMAAGEAVLGFPGALLAPMMEALTYLADKAIPRARAKRVFQALGEGGSQPSFLEA
jgi:uncharacterized protein (DUF169 family)